MLAKKVTNRDKAFFAWIITTRAMTTPVRRQYLQLKRQFPGAILFFRLGDFYETFDEDAQIASDALDIVLTSRNVANNQRVPMAGIPYHAAEVYIARLVKKGYKVAICEQVGEDPTNKNLMRREVVRVVTPGTVVEPELLETKRDNYLAALVVDDDRAGLAYLEVTTGEFAATEFSGPDVDRQLADELTRLGPAEIIVPEDTGELVPQRHIQSSTSNIQAPVSPYSAWRFELSNARQALLDHFDVATLDGFGLKGKPLAVRAAGAALQYLSETQQSALAQIAALSAYSTGTFMVLDSSTRHNLELTQTIRRGTVEGSLLGVLDQTVTPMGGRLLRRWLHEPLLDVGRLNQRLDAVEALSTDLTARREIASTLNSVGDMERLTSRVRQGIARPRDLVGLRRSLEAVPPILDTLEQLEARASTAAQEPERNPLFPELDPCPEVRSLVEQAIVDDPPPVLSATGVIRPGFSSELDGIASGASEAKTWIANLEMTERSRTGIHKLKVGYNKVFGYYLEIPRSQIQRAPHDYIRKQTLVNAERYITPELKEYESLILNAEERQLEVETRIFSQVCSQVGAAGPRLLATAHGLAFLDAIVALAEVAVRYNYVRPELTADERLEIKDGRHPVVEQMILSGQDAGSKQFVPNDVTFSDEELVLIITGPNMSGKSTYLRQVALIVLMAQMGSFVPAGSARIGLVDRIFTRIGAQDEIHAGQSTFMVEMVETAALLSQATPRSLLVLDEVGRGTSTYDGLAIARAVVEHIHNNPLLRAKTLFATHYHELVELEKYLPQVRNYNVAVTEDGNRVVFLHRIVRGGADRSYGIHVAQLAGIPKPVVNRANEILEELERNSLLREQKARTRQAFGARQLSLFGPETHPLIEALTNLKIEELSPLEALNKLYELQLSAREDGP
jgi:DNA mismatch repair protein MutS